MHIWELLIRDENTGADLIVQALNPTSGTEGQHMLFATNKSDKWIATGTYNALLTVKDGQIVAEYKFPYSGKPATAGVAVGWSGHSVYQNNWLKTPQPVASRQQQTVNQAAVLWYPLNPNTYPQTAVVRSPIQVDKWEIMISSVNDEPLLCAEIPPQIPGVDTEVLLPSGTLYTQSGTVGSAQILKNGAVVANVPAMNQVIKVLKGDMVGNGDSIYFCSSDWCLPKPRPAEPVCDCGGWVTYGKEANIHEDSRFFVCSLRKAER